MIAFLFPGQGAQVVGMGSAFYQTSLAARAVFAEADEALGFDLARLTFEGPAFELNLTANTQPAVLTVSVAVAAACAERGLTPMMVAGHSVGEYSALVVAGALRFREAVRLVRKRGQFMQDAVPVGKGAMAAVIGVQVARLEALCAEVAEDEVVEIAGINSADQVVIAGHRAAVARVVARVSAGKATKGVLLPVSAPFHCSLMSPVVPRLADELEAVAVADPAIPLARNVDGEVTRRAAEVRPTLLAQVTRPVRWTECVRRLVADGATEFFEVGPGRVLTELNRKIVRGAGTFPVATPAQLDQALAAASMK